MSTAIAIHDAFVPLATTTPDGIKWLQVVADSNIYEHYKSLPNVVKYNGCYYQKMSFNSDSFLIHYKELSESQIAFPKS